MPSKIDFRDGIIYISDHGTTSQAEAQEVADTVLGLIRERGLDSAPLLVDLLESPGVSSDARRVFGKLVADDAVAAVAYVTESTFMRVAANFVTRASGADRKTQFFTDADAAMDWLKA